MVFRKLLSKPLDPARVQWHVAAELQQILEACSPCRVYLFGSAARGEMTDASDLDFLIVLPDAANMKEQKKAYYRSIRSREIPVDTVFVTESDFQTRSQVGGICFVVADEGKLLYDNSDESE